MLMTNSAPAFDRSIITKPKMDQVRICFALWTLLGSPAEVKNIIPPQRIIIGKMIMPRVIKALIR